MERERERERESRERAAQRERGQLRALTEAGGALTGQGLIPENVFGGSTKKSQIAPGQLPRKKVYRIVLVIISSRGGILRELDM